MNINDKIKQILIDKNYSPSYFADEIGVQRSSISHILSGRNRPSFDIIQKIIRRFPELGYEWIMEDESQNQSVQHTPVGGSMARYGQGNAMHPNNLNRYDSMNGPQRPASSSASTIRSQRHEIAPASTPQVVLDDEHRTSTSVSADQTPDAETAPKKVERILIFYTDGSFREYTPAIS